MKCAVIIVTHQSDLYLAKCLRCLFEQTFLPEQIIIVDSGSSSKNYLEKYEKEPLIKIIYCQKNVGFCQGNNIGMSHLKKGIDFILFLNPDAFLSASFLQDAVNEMEAKENQRIGVLSGILLGYDIALDQPTGKVDSTGIFRTFYGRWYDRDQGKDLALCRYHLNEKVPALCGALLFCRKLALEEVMLSPFEVMDKRFFMYKEDIDLSLRLQRKGWSLLFCPALEAYHCRGWKKDRKQVPKQLKMLSAKNEVLLYSRLRSPFLFYSLLKYLTVKLFNV